MDVSVVILTDHFSVYHMKSWCIMWYPFNLVCIHSHHCFNQTHFNFELWIAFFLRTPFFDQLWLLERVAQMGDSGEKSTSWFFRWFWDFLKEENFLVSVFFTQKFYIKLFFQMQSLFSFSTALLSFNCRNYH